VEKPSGKKTTREVVEHSDCIAVVALDEQDNVLLVRQFRHAVGKFLLEIPAGGINPGEEPIDSVRRELQEEIGYLPRKIDKLGGFYAIPGYGTEYLHCFLVIASGGICDAKSIAALLSFLFIRQGE
jgi:ADP-ribose pyrophosphatase